EMSAKVAQVLVGHAVVIGRPVDGHRLIGQTERVVRVDLEFPVDPLHRVPLLVLALLVQRQQLLPAVVVLPVEAGLAGERNLPQRRPDRRRVQVVGGHGRTSSAGTLFPPWHAPYGIVKGLRASGPPAYGMPPSWYRSAIRRSVSVRSESLTKVTKVMC